MSRTVNEESLQAILLPLRCYTLHNSKERCNYGKFDSNDSKLRIRLETNSKSASVKRIPLSKSVDCVGAEESDIEVVTPLTKVGRARGAKGASGTRFLAF